MRIQELHHQERSVHCGASMILLIVLLLATFSISVAFALTLPHRNSTLPMAATLNNNLDLVGLSLEEKTGNPSVNLGALGLSTGKQLLTSESLHDPIRPLDFSYQVTDDSFVLDSYSTSDQELLTDFSANTFSPMWISESTGKALHRLMQLYGPGMGIQ